MYNFLQLVNINNSISYKINNLICNICLNGTEWFNFKSSSINKQIYNIKKTQILIEYMLFNYGLLTNQYYNYFVENISIISISIKTHISLYIKKKYLQHITNYSYWIFKEKYKLLLYDIYWHLILNKRIYSYLQYYIKKLLYTKDSLKRWRINNHIKLNKLTDKIFSLLIVFYESSNIFTSFNILVELYILFSKIIYFWYKKICKKILKINLYNKYNRKLFFTFISNIKKRLLFIIFLQQFNR
uniref:Reverse transcriptase N-terminal domain-containing protein n=1 Tax=Hydropuntia rangiferina TaxID=338881 RepID=A0A345U8B6_9FLOR|nr:hypothetical protein [Hydropuntia rangiferina]AXI96702.1 hypothetical protein [Hydropuntia rangiferina]UAD87385.1 hypothetical protein [Hydropuntia rangiferina]